MASQESQPAVKKSLVLNAFVMMSASLAGLQMEDDTRGPCKTNQSQAAAISRQAYGGIQKTNRTVSTRLSTGLSLLSFWKRQSSMESLSLMCSVSCRSYRPVTDLI